MRKVWVMNECLDGYVGVGGKEGEERYFVYGRSGC